MRDSFIIYNGYAEYGYNFSCGDSKTLSISFPNYNICRLRVQNPDSKPSIMVGLGYVNEKISDVASDFSENDCAYEIKSDKLCIIIFKDGSGITISDPAGNRVLKTGSLVSKFSKVLSLMFNMLPDEHFYGFGFQRKTLDARGHVLTFKKEYRWNEATVPYFLSSSGYGLFSANTYDHKFDFTGSDFYSIDISGGDMDFFIMYGPGFKDIISSYTALTGRPHMIPKWGLGLCYVARLFENQEGLIKIAEKFRAEGIPCDMLGLEPGWEEHYYQMKWVWNKDMFPDPKGMIDKLHNMGYAFELWESGDAPKSGYMNPENREKWFAERISSSIDIGVDFYKQDDPYPRCITSEEMVNNPTVEMFIEDDDGYSQAETKNIANTLYSTTVFDEMRRLTDKRAFIIFYSYGATTSSQMYPCAWAGDFNLGNGALNASFSGHAMATQDMRSEVPLGIHFGFMMPFVFMDSWAYYLEPWLFSEHIKDILKFYSRLRISLFPYLYTALWQSHTTGLPMLRPMILEYQDDPAALNLDKQFMLGDNLLVGIIKERGECIYLPKGNWIDYWSREIIESEGDEYICEWPSSVGGPLFVKAGSVIPMTNATDSISLNNFKFLYLDLYPGDDIKSAIYEDDGITYGYEVGDYSITEIICIESGNDISINLCKPSGDYSSGYKAILTRVLVGHKPGTVKNNVSKLSEVNSFDSLLYSDGIGWFYNDNSNALYIKTSSWKFSEKLEDTDTFYKGKIEWNANPVDVNLDILITKSERDENLITEKCKNILTPIPKGSEFQITVNPPQRVRLNHGDDWLPYYIYVGFEIVRASKRIYSVNPIVTLEISCKDDRNIIKNHTTMAYDGVGHFKKIIVGSPSEPPDVLLTLSAEGVKTRTIRYNPQTT